MPANQLMSGLALLAAAAAVGLACGAAVTATEPLPAAGSTRDDGAGLLARLSSADTLMGLMLERTMEPATTYGGALYGGALYGGSRYGALYGGSRYGGYRFARNAGAFATTLTPRYARGYVHTDAGARGQIVGQVVWRDPPRAAKGRASDGSSASAGCAPDTGVRVDERGRVAGAVVYLKDVYLGRRGLAPKLGYSEGAFLQLGGTVRVDGCAYVPRVQLLSPTGTRLRLISDSPTPSDMVVEQGGAELVRVPVSRAVPRDVGLVEPGMASVRDVRLPGSAWVAVASHPYYTISDDDGSFRLDDVPPGTYTLVVWHPPVSYSAADGTAVHVGPVILERSVDVRPNAPVRVTLALPKARP